MLEVRPLRPEDDRSSFSSGNPDLDSFFKKYAGQNQFKLHIGTTYIAIDDKEVFGFITLSASSITIEDLPKEHRKRLPRYPLPVLRIARLAVSTDAQGKGTGKKLLRTAFLISQEMSKTIGCIGIVVDAKADAVSFYHRCGFLALDVVLGKLHDRPKRPQPMFLAQGTIKKAINILK